jgi:hypothetical protein
MDDFILSIDLIDVSDEFGAKRPAKYSVFSNIHSRLEFYKKKTSDFKSDQEERRKQILAEQKKYIYAINNYNLIFSYFFVFYFILIIFILSKRKRQQIVQEVRTSQCQETQKTKESTKNQARPAKRSYINPEYVDKVKISSIFI